MNILVLGAKLLIRSIIYVFQGTIDADVGIPRISYHDTKNRNGYHVRNVKVTTDELLNKFSV